MRPWRLFSFALVAACANPHASNVDRSDCRSCHPAPAVTDPLPGACVQPTDHTVYASTCADCHGTAAWCPADATHDRFELTGDHEGWDCADCHLAIQYEPPAILDPEQITCTSCHWHSADRTDPFHIGKGEYTYAPASCLEAGCHGSRP